MWAIIATVVFDQNHLFFDAERDLIAIVKFFCLMNNFIHQTSGRDSKQ